MKKEQHLEITKIIFNKEYTKVHEWLDETAKEYFDKGWNVFEHWKHRHHIQAIKDKYGEGTIEFLVAWLHIICDWISHLNMVEIPLNEEEVVQILTRENVI